MNATIRHHGHVMSTARRAYRRRYPEVIAAEIYLRCAGMAHTIPPEGISARAAVAILANVERER